MHCQCSANITAGTAEPKHDIGKQREEPITDMQAHSVDDPSPSAHHDTLRPSFLERARSSLSRRQNDEGIELLERRPAIVDVPFAKLKHVSAPFFHLTRSTSRMSFRCTTQRDNLKHVWRKRKRMQEMQRMRMLLQAAHGLFRVTTRNLLERLKLNRLRDRMRLSPLRLMSVLMLLLLQPPRQ
jgi:hypothetical protein